MSEQVTKFIVPKDKAWNAETHSKAMPHEQLMVLAAEHDYAIRSLHAEAEALRAENGRLREGHERLFKLLVFLRIDSTEARILLRDIAPFFAAPHGRDDLHHRIDAFLTSTPVPDHLRDAAIMAEQGERQEAVAEQ